jgi:spore coat protein JB
MSVNEIKNYRCNNDNEETTCNYEKQKTVNSETRREMMQQIRCYEFAINELALYLDTHPDDEKALCLHKKYCKISKDLKDKYQKVYGPLTINYPCNKWRWLEEPWPWERGNF